MRVNVYIIGPRDGNLFVFISRMETLIAHNENLIYRISFIIFYRSTSSEYFYPFRKYRLFKLFPVYNIILISSSFYTFWIIFKSVLRLLKSDFFLHFHVQIFYDIDNRDSGFIHYWLLLRVFRFI